MRILCMTFLTVFAVLIGLSVASKPQNVSHKLCNQACNSSYVHSAHLNNSCVHGCRLFGMIFLSHDSALANSELSGMCRNACQKGFSGKLGGADARKACQRGCQHQERVFRANKVGAPTAAMSVLHGMAKLPEMLSNSPSHHRVFALMRAMHRRMLSAFGGMSGAVVQRVQIRIHSMPAGKDGKPRYQVQIHKYPMMSVPGGNWHSGFMRGPHMGPHGFMRGPHMGPHMGPHGFMRGHHGFMRGPHMDDDMFKRMQKYMDDNMMGPFADKEMLKQMEEHMGKGAADFMRRNMHALAREGRKRGHGDRHRAHGDRRQGDRHHGDRRHGDRRHGDRRHGDRRHGATHQEVRRHQGGVLFRVRHFFRNMNEPAKAGLRWSLCGLLVLSVVGLVWLCCSAFRSGRSRGSDSSSLTKALKKKKSVQSGDIFYVDVAKKPLIEDDGVEKARDEA